MARVTGLAAFRSALRVLPGQIEAGAARGAMRAFLEPIAAAAAANTKSDEVRESIKTSVATEPGSVIGRIRVGSYLAPWEEYGTARHQIGVKTRVRNGVEPKRVLSDGAHVFGRVVDHPGAAPHPFLRPAVDGEGPAGIAAAQAFLDKAAANGTLTAPEPVDPE